MYCTGIYLGPKNSARVDHLLADVSTPDFRNTKHSFGSFVSLMEALVGSVWRWRLLGPDKSSSGNYFPKFWRNQVSSNSKPRQILTQQHTASYSRRIKSSANERCENFKNSKYINYERIYQLDAIEYLFVYFQLDMFRAYTPIFRSNGCYNFFTYAAYRVLGVVRCWSWGVCVLVACCCAVQHATSTHTPQDRHLATPRTPYAAYVRYYNIRCSWRWAYKPETCRAESTHINIQLHQVGN